MSIGYGLNLEQTQKLNLTPELRQSITVLQLSSLELNRYIDQQLQENPLLELREDEPDKNAEPADKGKLAEASEEKKEYDLDWELYDDNIQNFTLAADLWSDNFDSYPLGSIDGQGGWKGWAGDPLAAGIVTADESLSGEQSQAIYGPADSVHEYSGYTAGMWSYTAMQYIPDDFTGESMFILLNTYTDAGDTNNWSTQVAFNGDIGWVYNYGWTEGYLPLITGEWVEIRVDINLDTNVQKFYYDGQLLYAGTWTEENSGGGALNIGAVDLFANGASVVYYDDISITVDIPEVCEFPGDIAWLSVDPAMGITASGASTPVTVTFDSTGMLTGTYTSTLCAVSNDKANPLVQIPLTLNVVDPKFIFLPLQFKAP